MNITITLTASPELLSVLTSIASLAPAKAAAQPAKKEKVVKEENLQVANQIIQSAVNATDEAPETPVVETDSSTTKVVTESEYTLEQVRATTQKKAQAGKKEEVKKLLDKYGAKNVSSLDADKYADFITEINAL